MWRTDRTGAVLLYGRLFLVVAYADTILLNLVILFTLIMGSQTEAVTDLGFGGSLNWLVGGAVGGLAGALIFGGVLWVVEPTAVTEAIPEMYGLDGGGMRGWAFHLLHGVILGILFGFLITRELVLGTLTADIETPVLDSLSLNTRIIGAGFLYGLVIWVFGPGVVLLVLVALGDIANPFPVASVYNLVGHLLYGSLLGALVSVFIDLEAEAHESDAPFEEASEGSRERRR